MDTQIAMLLKAHEMTMSDNSLTRWRGRFTKEFSERMITISMEAALANEHNEMLNAFLDFAISAASSHVAAMLPTKHRMEALDVMEHKLMPKLWADCREIMSNLDKLMVEAQAEIEEKSAAEAQATEEKPVSGWVR